MTEEEWGPWIEHDGSGCPLRVGSYTEEIGISPTGLPTEGSGFLNRDELPSWDWTNYGKIINGIAYGKVIRYRIRKPKALQQLREIAENVKEDA